MSEKKELKKIPFFFKPILWSYDWSKLDVQRDARAITVQTINYGQWRHWQWLAKIYGKGGVRRIIQEIPESEFRPSALKLARILYGVGTMKYASRSDYIRAKKIWAKLRAFPEMVSDPGRNKQDLRV